MRRILLVACLALASVATSARADTFAVVPNAAAAPTTAPVSAFSPNSAGSIGLPLDLLASPVQPQQLNATQLLDLWKRAGAQYGIPWEVLAAINKIESNFGRNMGPSSAGAIGWMQFMPDTWLRWGIDGNGDGVADPWNPQDAVFSAARYLAAAGGQTDLRGAVFAYNHADWYVNEVLSLAQTFAGGATFQIDGMQQSLDLAQAQVTAVNAALVAAQGRVTALTAVYDGWVAKQGQANLLSDQLALDKQATLAGVRVDAVRARIAPLQASLAQAQAALKQARANAQSVAFDKGAGSLLAAPSFQGNYVFPVGGGPGRVSASHTHHDFPAVDIAAPEGSPVYALADAIVVRSWAVPDVNCGIGVTMRTLDGLEWTYCHLSYLEPAVVAGAQLKAGDNVGLVGHTGAATGPHLHLQLQPPTQWPQQQPWFQQFGGVAFSWQDSGTVYGAIAPVTRTLSAFDGPATSQHPVFQVVPAAPAPSNEGAVLFTPGA
jgi:murein DD-endopeptidase MepM/ murein hydrolase activator NlpD